MGSPEVQILPDVQMGACEMQTIACSIDWEVRSTTCSGGGGAGWQVKVMNESPLEPWWCPDDNSAAGAGPNAAQRLYCHYHQGTLGTSSNRAIKKSESEIERFSRCWGVANIQQGRPI